MSVIAQELRSRFGPDILVDATALGAGTAAAPRSADELAAIMGLCSTNGWQVSAAGAGTWLRRPHSAAGLVVTTIRLSGVVEHEPEDLVVGVLAGTPMRELGSALQQHRQFLPLDPAAAPAATIGATVGLRCAGPLRAGYGTPRDLVLGLEVVTGDGRLLRFGGRVVKNVAGYDGVRLFTGSGGRLGIITSIFVRVRSVPRIDRTAALPAQNAAAAAALALRVRDAAGTEALEVVSPQLAAAAGLAGQWHVLVRLHGSREDVDERLARIRACSSAPDTDAYAAPLGPVWDRLCLLEADARPALEVTVPPAAVERVLPALQVHTGPGAAVAVHATEGVIRAWPVGPSQVPPAAAAAARELVADCGGTVRWLVPPAGVIEPRPSAPVDAAAELTRRIAAAFDPAGILQPDLQ